MSEQTFIRVLEQIRTIIDDALGSGSRPAKKAARREKAKPVSAKSASALPDHILVLKQSGFFKQPRTAVEDHEKLQSHYPCELNRVAVALLRLHKKRAVRKTSKTVGERKQIAYVA